MSVCVYFIGVCTHVRKDPGFTPWLNVPHRVVLVAARTEQMVGPHIIPKHSSFLIVNGEKPIDIGRGVTVTIGDGTGQVHYDDDYDRMMPRLLTLTPGFLPAPHVVQECDHTFADAYFDVMRGTLRPARAHKARAVELEIDDPSPVLRLRWWSHSERPDEYPLPPDSTICVLHVASGANEDDDRSHFLLHYGIAGPLLDLPVPDVKHYDGKPVPVQCNPFSSLGPGCSDSNYP